MLVKKLSVFFPCYNEEGSLERTVKNAIKILSNLNIDYEILIINDGSTDKTPQVADSLAKENPKIRVIHHPKNLGYGEALKSGFYNARNEIIVYTDGDGQFDFSEVTKFLEKIKDHDLIIGYRIKRQDPFFRILFAKGWALSLFAFFRLGLKDVDCGFKMIRKKVLEKIPHLESERGAMINAELVIKAKKAGFKVTQVGVNHYPRLSGRPTGANVRVIIKSFLDLVKLWWKVKKEKGFFILAILILVLAAFLRLFRISEYMIFLGDEGRDAIVIKDILLKSHFPLIGPSTSVGNIYLGPLYYYMMAIPMAIFWLNPVAAAFMDGLIGVATVGLIYIFGKDWFGKLSGVIAAFLYAISPLTIAYSNFSWNPNPTPFFALLAMLGFYMAHKSSDFRWLILTGTAVAAAIQMHYLALILLPIFTIIWLYEVIGKKRQIKNLIFGTFIGILAFILMMSPLFWFDLRHNFLNYRAIVSLFTTNNSLQGNIFSNMARIPTIYIHDLIGRYMAGENFYLTYVVGLLVILALLRLSWATVVLGVWLIVGLFGLSFYQKEIFDHYLGFLNPIPFLLLGSLAQVRFGKDSSKWVLGGLLILITALTIVNLQRNPLNNPPNNQLKRTQEVAKFIISQAHEKSFNFALLSKNNYDSAYQFYLDIYGHKPKQVPFDITEQLFVVCEDQICQPINNPKYEIAGFGWSKIIFEKEYAGVKIYKLIHNPSGKPS